MGDELKPCPFCGGEARIHSKVLAEGFDSGYWAVCDECGKGDTLPHESEEKAAAAWNARAAVTDEQFAMAVHNGEAWQRVRECHMVPVSLYDEEWVDGIECDECGWSDVHEWYDPMPGFCPNCGAKVAPC